MDIEVSGSVLLVRSECAECCTSFVGRAWACTQMVDANNKDSRCYDANDAQRMLHTCTFFKANSIQTVIPLSTPNPLSPMHASPYEHAVAPSECIESGRKT